MSPAPIHLPLTTRRHTAQPGMSGRRRNAAEKERYDMRRLLNAIKPRLMNLLFVLVYIAGFAVTALDVFVWRP